MTASRILVKKLFLLIIKNASTRQLIEDFQALTCYPSWLKEEKKHYNAYAEWINKLYLPHNWWLAQFAVLEKFYLFHKQNKIYVLAMIVRCQRSRIEIKRGLIYISWYFTAMKGFVVCVDMPMR